MKHLVGYERAPERWPAYVPDLSRRLATGEAHDETEPRIREAIEVHLHAMQANGEPIAEPCPRTGLVEVA